MSYCAAARIQGKKTVRIQGTIQNKDILILVDSGSSGTFISNKLVKELQLHTQSCAPVLVTLAYGGKLSTNQVVQDLEWWTQGHSFSSDARVLSVGCYDLILSMDWLEVHSPMWVDWKRKRLRFSYKGQRITLSGVKHCLSTFLLVKPLKLKGMIKRGRVDN